MSDLDALSGEDGTHTPCVTPQVVFPLNSRKLVTPLVHQLAVAMGLPVEASPADVRQMIEGQLISEGCEPQNVQVGLSDSTWAVTVTHTTSGRQWSVL